MGRKYKMRKAAAAAAAAAAAGKAAAQADLATDESNNNNNKSSGRRSGNDNKNKNTKSNENTQKQNARAIHSRALDLLDLAAKFHVMPSGTRKSQPSSGSGSSASDSSDSDDAPDQLAVDAGAGGLQKKLEANVPSDSLGSTPKYSRGEKKARRLLMKLDLEPIPNVSRVTMRKTKNVLLCIDQPAVFKCPHTKTIICFGEVRIENTSNAAAAQAAERYINDVHVRAPQTLNLDHPLAANDGEEIDVAALASELDEKDIELVQMQAGCPRPTAIKALIKHKSDVVNAIMELTVGVDI